MIIRKRFDRRFLLRVLVGFSLTSLIVAAYLTREVHKISVPDHELKSGFTDIGEGIKKPDTGLLGHQKSSDDLGIANVRMPRETKEENNKITQTSFNWTCVGFTWPTFSLSEVTHIYVNVTSIRDPNAQISNFSNPIGGLELSHEICNLEPYTPYYVTVTAVGANPGAEETYSGIVWTMHDTPPTLAPLTVVDTTDHTITVAIPEIRLERGPLTAIELRLKKGEQNKPSESEEENPWKRLSPVRKKRSARKLEIPIDEGPEVVWKIQLPLMEFPSGLRVLPMEKQGSTIVGTARGLQNGLKVKFDFLSDCVTVNDEKAHKSMVSQVQGMDSVATDRNGVIGIDPCSSSHPSGNDRLSKQILQISHQPDAKDFKDNSVRELKANSSHEKGLISTDTSYVRTVSHHLDATTSPNVPELVNPADFWNMSPSDRASLIETNIAIQRAKEAFVDSYVEKISKLGMDENTISSVLSKLDRVFKPLNIFENEDFFSGSESSQDVEQYLFSHYNDFDEKAKPKDSSVDDVKLSETNDNIEYFENIIKSGSNSDVINHQVKVVGTTISRMSKDAEEIVKPSPANSLGGTFKSTITSENVVHDSELLNHQTQEMDKSDVDDANELIENDDANGSAAFMKYNRKQIKDDLQNDGQGIGEAKHIEKGGRKFGFHKNSRRRRSTRSKPRKWSLWSLFGRRQSTEDEGKMLNPLEELDMSLNTYLDESVKPPRVVKTGYGFYITMNNGRRVPYFGHPWMLRNRRILNKLMEARTYLSNGTMHLLDLNTLKDEDILVLRSRLQQLLNQNAKRWTQLYQSMFGFVQDEFHASRNKRQITVPDKSKKGLPPGYTAARTQIHKPQEMTLGDQQKHGNVPNPPLDPDTQYEVILVVLSTVVDVTKHSWTSVNATTKPETPKVMTPLFVILIGAFLAVLVFVLLLSCFMLWCGRRKSKSPGPRDGFEDYKITFPPNTSQGQGYMNGSGGDMSNLACPHKYPNYSPGSHPHQYATMPPSVPYPQPQPFQIPQYPPMGLPMGIPPTSFPTPIPGFQLPSTHVARPARSSSSTTSSPSTASSGDDVSEDSQSKSRRKTKGEKYIRFMDDLETDSSSSGDTEQDQDGSKDDPTLPNYIRKVYQPEAHWNKTYNVASKRHITEKRDNVRDPMAPRATYYNDDANGNADAKGAPVTFRQEFQSLSEGINMSSNALVCPIPVKNRFAHIALYEHSRVTLIPDESSDVTAIHANYINGYPSANKSNFAYIAAMSPYNPDTVLDFWRLIYQHGVQTVVMLTNVLEDGIVKCAQYWPPGGTTVRTFGHFLLQTVEEHVFPGYVVRKIQMCSQTDHTVRDITHFQLTSCPFHALPASPVPWLEMRNKVRIHHGNRETPILVHCGTGCSRSAVFIAIDSLIDQFTAEGQVGVFSFVQSMRDNRPMMVRSLDQYVFIYSAILEHFQAGDTRVRLDIGYNNLRTELDTVNPRTGSSYLEDEFELLNFFSLDLLCDDVSIARQLSNRSTSTRQSRISSQPLECGLPGPGFDSLKAVFLDGHRTRDQLVLMDTPGSDTSISEFWRFLRHYDVTSVVQLGHGATRENLKSDRRSKRRMTNKSQNKSSDLVKVQNKSTNMSMHYEAENGKMINDKQPIEETIKKVANSLEMDDNDCNRSPNNAMSESPTVKLTQGFDQDEDVSFKVDIASVYQYNGILIRDLVLMAHDSQGEPTTQRIRHFSLPFQDLSWSKQACEKKLLSCPTTTKKDKKKKGKNMKGKKKVGFRNSSLEDLRTCSPWDRQPSRNFSTSGQYPLIPPPTSQIVNKTGFDNSAPTENSQRSKCGWKRWLPWKRKVLPPPSRQSAPRPTITSISGRGMSYQGTPNFNQSHHVPTLHRPSNNAFMRNNRRSSKSHLSHSRVFQYVNKAQVPSGVWKRRSTLRRPDTKSLSLRRRYITGTERLSARNVTQNSQYHYSLNQSNWTLGESTKNMDQGCTYQSLHDVTDVIIETECVNKDQSSINKCPTWKHQRNTTDTLENVNSRIVSEQNNSNSVPVFLPKENTLTTSHKELYTQVQLPRLLHSKLPVDLLRKNHHILPRALNQSLTTRHNCKTTSRRMHDHPSSMGRRVSRRWDPKKKHQRKVHKRKSGKSTETRTQIETSKSETVENTSNNKSKQSRHSSSSRSDRSANCLGLPETRRPAITPPQALQLLELVWDWHTTPLRRGSQSQQCRTPSGAGPNDSVHLPPVVIHSPEGSADSAILAACAVICECLQESHEVDVYHAIKHIRRRCPTAIHSFEDYEFLYDCLGVYISDYLDDVPFTQRWRFRDAVDVQHCSAIHDIDIRPPTPQIPSVASPQPVAKERTYKPCKHVSRNRSPNSRTTSTSQYKEPHGVPGPVVSDNLVLVDPNKVAITRVPLVNRSPVYSLRQDGGNALQRKFKVHGKSSSNDDFDVNKSKIVKKRDTIPPGVDSCKVKLEEESNSTGCQQMFSNDTNKKHGTLFSFVRKSPVTTYTTSDDRMILQDVASSEVCNHDGTGDLTVAQNKHVRDDDGASISGPKAPKQNMKRVRAAPDESFSKVDKEKRNLNTLCDKSNQNLSKVKANGKRNRMDPKYKFNHISSQLSGATATKSGVKSLARPEVLDVSDLDDNTDGSDEMIRMAGRDSVSFIEGLERSLLRSRNEDLLYTV